jgi:cyanophycinase-like exopeptidase
MDRHDATTPRGERQGVVYLAGSGESGVLGALVARAIAGVARRPVRVAASFAAVGNSERALASMQRSLASMFGDAVVERFAVEGERGAMSAERARAIVEDADVIFVSGGDPVLGAKTLVAAGADAWLRDARARGASLVGVSAGSIMLCAFWGEWDDDDPSAVGAPIDCTRVVPDLVVDCHDEDGDWEELRLVGAMRPMRAPSESIRFRGIPSGGALIVDAHGDITSFGRPPFVLNLAPR